MYFGNVASPARALLPPIVAALALAAPGFSQALIQANSNRVPAGTLSQGVLHVQLEIRQDIWYPEADNGPALRVLAFAEAGHAAQIPGPLLRVPAGTAIEATVTNRLAAATATVYGLATRPIASDPGVAIAPGKSHDFVFPAGTPGTYYYWARTTPPLPTVLQPVRADAQLNGAFIVDPPGAVAPDRIFVIDMMVLAANPLHRSIEVPSINGKMYPYTEALQYTQGERIRWRVINPSFSEHPMHLHGSFYDVLSLGNYERDTSFPPGERETVVTQDLVPEATMMMEWTPPHPGRWLFHCHFNQHISTGELVPEFAPASAAASWAPSAPPVHDEMPMMRDMAGLVLAITVKPSPVAAPPAAAPPPRKIELVLARGSGDAKTPIFTCTLHEGGKTTASAPGESMGPPLVLTRGQPVAINVVNHMNVPTTIHWHGIELDSYYDGVAGAGEGTRLAPAIQPGASFLARFTPEQAGTFLYHTHAADPTQLAGGVYGPLIVLPPGATYDPDRDRVLVIGARDDKFTTTQVTLNGRLDFEPMTFRRGVTYRLRIANIAPDLYATVQLGPASHPVEWHALAKDGADLPPRLAVTEPAQVHIVSGETYDFEFQPDAAGEVPFQIENTVTGQEFTETFHIQ